MKQSNYDKIVDEMYSPLAKELIKWDIEQIKQKKAKPRQQNI